MFLSIWNFDGFDLIYTEENKMHLTGLEFDEEEDALYALRCFRWFLEGCPEGDEKYFKFIGD